MDKKENEIVEKVKGHVRNKRPANMSLDEPDQEKAAKKAALFNKLMELNRRQGIAKFDSVDEMEQIIDDYFYNCGDIGIRPTIRGLASALGTVYETLNGWERGERDGTLGSSCSALVKKTKQIIAQYDELMAMESLDNPILFMFRAKNYYGMKDTQDVNIVANNALGDEKTAEEIARAIPSDIPIDVDFTE